MCTRIFLIITTHGSKENITEARKHLPALRNTASSTVDVSEVAKEGGQTTLANICDSQHCFSQLNVRGEKTTSILHHRDKLTCLFQNVKICVHSILI